MQKSYTETLKIKGSQLYEKINVLAKEGNERLVIIKNKKGREIVRFPMTLGVVFAVMIIYHSALLVQNLVYAYEA